MKFVVLKSLVLCLCLMTLPVQAQSLNEKKEQLEKTKSTIGQTKSDLKKLEKKSKELEKDLEETRDDLSNVASRIKGNEQALIELEKNIENAEIEKSDIQKRLELDSGAMSALILAMERVRRVPPEAMILKPGAPYETAQSVMILQSILPQLQGRAQSFQEDLERLASLLNDLDKQRTDLTTKQKELDQNRKEIEILLAKRKTIMSQTQRDFKERENELQTIARQASTLKQLVEKLEEDIRIKRAEEKRKREELAQQRASASKPKPVYNRGAALPPSGKGQLPVSGLIAVAYGQTDDIGAKSQGIHIEARSQALVVAPMAGRVQFAGPFKNYGQLVIIEHEKGYHSLIGGLQRIDINPNQVLKSGEPIGILPVVQDAQNPQLYYELRYKGRPVDPAKKIVNLKS